MNSEIVNWDEIPDIITKDQLYRICHISKTTALYLLRSGKIPCEYSGKKTRCYKIRKSDVKKYLDERAIFPEAYSAPIGWYCNGHKALPKEVPSIVLEDMSEYYVDLLKAYSDVMRVKDVSAFCGYSIKTINRWCAKGWIQHFKKGFNNYMPKVFLIAFLCSINFRAINKKSDKHIKMLHGFRAWKKLHIRQNQDTTLE